MRRSLRLLSRSTLCVLVISAFFGLASPALAEPPVQRLTSDPAAEIDVAWAPSGNKILFSRYAGAEERRLWEESVTTTSTGTAVRLTNGGWPYGDWWPAYRKPNGTSFWYMHTDPQTWWYIYSQTGTGAPKNLWRVPGGHTADLGPQASSPDGSKMAYAYHNDPWRYSLRRARIVIANADNSNPVTVYQSPAMPRPNWGESLFHVAWSPDGSKLAFNMTLNGSSDIYVINANGTGLRRVTDWPGTEASAVWSPDGKRIAFQSDKSGNWDIWSIGADGADAHQLTTSNAADISPDWSSKDRIAFCSSRTGNFDVYAVSDNQIPAISADSASVVTVEGSAATAGGTATDSDGDVLSLSATTGGVSLTGSRWTWTAPAVDGPSAYDVTVTANDGKGGTASTTFHVDVHNAAPVITSLAGPTEPVQLGDPASIQGAFTDAGTLDTHAAVIDWGDGTTSVGLVDEQAGSGTIASTHTYLMNGVYTVAATVTDKDGASAVRTLEQQIVVNAAPVVATDSGSATTIEGDPVTISGTVTDADGDAVELTADKGTLTRDGADWTWTSTPQDGPDAFDVTLTAADGNGGTASATLHVDVTNAAPQITSLTGTTAPVLVGTATHVSGAFTDAGVLDTHEAVIEWGDGTTSAATVTEDGGNGCIAADHTYSKTGIFTVVARVTDKDGASAERTLEQQVVVYDPAAGFLTGSGMFVSPKGSLAANRAWQGKASLTLNAKYLKNANVPTGEMGLHLQGAGFVLKSRELAWLVVDGETAVVSGTASIDGKSGYDFVVTIVDHGKQDSARIVVTAEDGSVAYEAASALDKGGEFTIHK